MRDEREKAAKANRERMPRFAAWLDTIRQFDPKARVQWAREGELEVGVVPKGTLPW